MTKIDILTPVGRLVAGDIFKANTTDHLGQPLVIKNGPNAGQPRTEYFFAIAIPKADPGWPALHAKIKEVAKAGFPTLFDAAGNCVRPDFAWKITDGDSTTPNMNGTIPANKEGYAGCWVLSFKSSFAPQAYTKGGEQHIVDPEQIKKGYYIRVYGNVSANGMPQKPGVFMNPHMVELVGYGEEIVSGPDGSAIFGSTPAPLPAGASATPTAGTPIAAPSNIHPAPDFLNPPAAPAPAPAAPTTYTVGGAQYTAEQLKAAGWTVAQIIALDEVPF